MISCVVFFRLRAHSRADEVLSDGENLEMGTAQARCFYDENR